MTPRADAILKAVLVAANLVALNFLVAPVRARIDLTDGREYTISDVTKKSLAGLPDRIEILGYFSEETHPKLAPLVPKLRDLVEEYRIHSGGKVVSTFVDPRTNEDAEKEAYQRFDVRPMPVPIETRYESGVKSIYFALVVAYGDRYQKLSVEDLIQVDRAGMTDIRVRLRNPEYQLTRAIEKVVREFGSVETRVAELTEPMRLLVFLSGTDAVPQGELRDFVAKKRKQMDEVSEELKKKFKAGFAVEMIDPASRAGLADEVRQIYGVAPLRASAASTASFYLDAIVRYGNKAERVAVRDLPDRERGTGEIREAVEAAVRRLLPGALRRVGIAGPKINIPPEMMLQYYQRGEQPPGDDFQRIRASLRAAHEVVPVDLEGGKPPLDVDVLLVLKPKGWSEKQQLALDQYLMYGGKAIVCLDVAELNLQARKLALEPIDPGVDQLLGRYGVTVRRELVLDDRNVPYPLPVVRDLGGIRLQTVEQVPYPWFLDVRGDSIDRDNPVTGSVDALELFWAAPLGLDPAKTGKARGTRLVSTSDRAWTTTDLANVEPTMGARGERKGYKVPEKVGRETIAVALEGPFTSGFKDRPEAVTGGAGFEALFESPPSARLVVIGDADFVSDVGAQISAGFKNNVQFLENLIDWALLDEAMIRIRSKGAADRPLEEVDREQKLLIEATNYVVPIALVIGFGVVRGLVRRAGARRVRTAMPVKEAAK